MPYFHPMPYSYPLALAEVIRYIVSLRVNNTNQICQLLKDVLLIQNVHSITITILGFGLMGCHLWKIELS